MPFPARFYYPKTKGLASYTNTPTGIFSVTRFINGKSYWRLPTSQVLTPRKLVIADWTLQFLNTEELETVLAKLELLRKEKFSLYIEQSGQIKPLDDLSILRNESVRAAIKPAFSEDIARAAVTQHHFTHDEVHVLDDYGISQLLEKSPPESYSLSLRHYLSLAHEERLTLRKIIAQRTEPFVIVHDVFSPDAHKVLRNLLESFPLAAKKWEQYHELSGIYAGHIKSALNQQNIVDDEFILEPAQLSQIEELKTREFNPEIDELSDLSDGDHTLPLDKLLKACPKLKKLDLVSCTLSEITTGCCDQLKELRLQSISLSPTEYSALFTQNNLLETFELYSYKPLNLTEIEWPLFSHLKTCKVLIKSTQDLNLLLEKIPQVETLELTFEEDNFSIPACTFHNLKTLKIHGNISPSNLQRLLEATPNLRKLFLTKSVISAKDFDQFTQLQQIEELELFAESKIESPLSHLAQIMPQLRTLTLSSYDISKESVLINTKNFENLEEISLLGKSFMLVLPGSPSLKKIYLSKESTLAGDSKADTNIEEITFLNSPITRHRFLNILILPAMAKLKKINFIGCDNISEKDLKDIRNGWPHLQIDSKQFSTSRYVRPEIETPTSDPVHTTDTHLHFKPTPANTPFTFEGKNKTQDQGMIIEKLCQYLTLTDQHKNFLSRIKDGICNGLVHFFAGLKSEEWTAFMEAVSTWNGKSQTLSPVLTKYFERLWPYVENYHLHPSGHSEPKHFFGLENILPIINAMPQGQAYVLHNPWHTIGIKRLEADVFQIYDPNFVEGAKEISSTGIRAAIQHAIGTEIFGENIPLPALRMPFDPAFLVLHLMEKAGILALPHPAAKHSSVIASQEQFLAEGGLLVLAGRPENVNDILKQVIPLHELSNAALKKALCLRDTNGIPAWVCGISSTHPAVAALTRELLQQFVEKISTAMTILQDSIEVLTPDQKVGCIAQLAKLFTQPTSTNFSAAKVQTAAPLSGRVTAPSPASPRPDIAAQLIEAVRTTSDTSHYETRLQTWNMAPAIATTLLEYTHHCLHALGRPSKEIQKRLITVNSISHLDGLRFALQQTARNIHRPVFYIHDPEEMICSAPFISQAGNQGVLKKGPGGKLHDFLTDPGNSQGVLIVNYAAFKPEDRIRLNSLLTKRKIDGTDLPPGMLTIGLVDTKSFQESPGFSRDFDLTEACPASGKELTDALPPLSVTDLKSTSSSAKKGFVINLFHSADWKEMLIGRWDLTDRGFIYQPGELANAHLNTDIEIQNAPWDDREFQLFWQEAISQGVVLDALGYPVFSTKNLSLSKSEGYDWSNLAKFIEIETGFPKQFVPILNPHCLTDIFLSHYEYNQGSLKKTPGLIEKSAAPAKSFVGTQNVLSVYVTRSLSEDEWAMLLTECRKHRVLLQIQCAPGVTLPEKLQAQKPPLPTSLVAEIPFHSEVVDATTVIISDEMDTTVAEIQKNSGIDWEIIDVSECNAADLLLRLEGNVDQHSLSFQFTQTESALLTGLRENKSILLKGHFSAELADKLAPFLLKRLAQPSQPGKLVLVSDNPEAFQYLSYQTHAATAAEKLDCLEISPDSEMAAQLAPFLAKNESLSMLKTRLAFLKQYPDKSSDDAWKGLYVLQNTQQTFEDLHDEQTAIANAALFMKERRESVRNKIQNAPYVFLAGLSGVGKSTFVSETLCDPKDMLYHGEDKMLAWAEDKTTTGFKFLFIDEANLLARDYSEFELPESVLISGKLYPLTPEHKIIFAGNPLSYGGDRTLPKLFQRHGNTHIFPPLSSAVLYGDILKPLFEKTFFADKAFTISTHFLAVYRFLVKCSTTDVLITPRELQMMALLTLAHCEDAKMKGNSVDENAIAKYYAFAIAKKLVPENHRREFEKLYSAVPLMIPVQIPGKTAAQLSVQSPPSSATLSVPHTEPLVTDSRKPVYTLLEDLLNLRKYRQAHSRTSNLAQRCGGLGGIIIEDTSEASSSALVIHCLLSQGLKEIHRMVQPSIPGLYSPAKGFYRLKLPLDTDQLLQAFHEGAVVFVENFNSAPMPEELLNALLMGKTPNGEFAQNPGFTFIAAQKPCTEEGLFALPSALSRRLINVSLPAFTSAEMLAILERKGLSPAKANELLLAFETTRAQAEREHLKPAPNFDDVLKLADEIIAASARQPIISPTISVVSPPLYTPAPGILEKLLAIVENIYQSEPSAATTQMKAVLSNTLKGTYDTSLQVIKSSREEFALNHCKDIANKHLPTLHFPHRLFSTPENKSSALCRIVARLPDPDAQMQIDALYDTLSVTSRPPRP